jgi:hypothetical protein
MSQKHAKMAFILQSTEQVTILDTASVDYLDLDKSSYHTYSTCTRG